MYVVDISDEDRLEENYETIRKVQLHKDNAKKPLLVVLNKKKPTELDDFDFSINADLNAVGSQQNQMIFVTHVNEYKGELDNVKHPPPPVSKRPQRAAVPLLTQFCVFVDKARVQAAELALKIRQQAERDERRIRFMQQEHEKRNSEIALLQGRQIAGNGDVRHVRPASPIEEQEAPPSVHRDELVLEREPEIESKAPTGSTQPSVSDTQSHVGSRSLSSSHPLTEIADRFFKISENRINTN
ncbi:hypothetical protein OESDEN_14204 [Oesophagostomum dentatum]|uniref:Uncharacterized protein n=1 Tax=Oesophagostomum dentatum TaxID=61180 RepID=A0A0B1SRC6_OESDE|nr:hypothetical protein OESDEN_14204 [Oesophagostomum dentatum]